MSEDAPERRYDAMTVVSVTSLLVQAICNVDRHMPGVRTSVLAQLHLIDRLAIDGLNEEQTEGVVELLVALKRDLARSA